MNYSEKRKLAIENHVEFICDTIGFKSNTPEYYYLPLIAQDNSHNYKVYNYLPPKFRDDDKFMLAILLVNPMFFNYYEKDYKPDINDEKDYFEYNMMTKHKKNALEYINKKSTDKFRLRLVEYNSKYYKHINEKNRTNEIILNCIREVNIDKIPKSFFTIENCKKIVDKDVELIYDFKDILTEDIYKILVDYVLEKDISNIFSIPQYMQRLYMIKKYLTTYKNNHNEIIRFFRIYKYNILKDYHEFIEKNVKIVVMDF